MSDLPAGWTETTLGEISSQGQYGWTSKAAEKGRVKYLRTTDITSGHLNWDTVPYCQDNPSNVEKYKIEPGDILISRAGSVGFSALIEDVPSTPAVFASYLIRYIPNSQVNPKFIARFLQSPNYWQQISDASAGIALANVNAKKLANVILPLPPLNEQKRIAEKLDTLLARVDSCQTHLERVPQILKRFRQSVLAAACEGKLVSQDSSEGTAEELLQTILVNRKQKLKKYKEPLQVDFSELDYVPSLPPNWTWVTLDQLTWCVKDGPHYSPQYAEDGIPFITGGNVRPDGVDFENAKRISPELHAELSKRVKPERGDILYTKGGTTGIARVNTYDIDFNVWVHVAVLKLCSPVNVFYLQHALNSGFCYNQAQKYTHGVGNQDLGLTRMIKIAIPLPPLEEQRRIVAEVEKLFAYAERLEARYTSASEHVERLTPSLLAKAFRGELVTQDPNDESAEKLLERIKEAIAKTPKESKKSQRRTTMKSTKSKQDGERISIIQALQDAEKALSSDQLFAAAGFPSDAAPDLVEEFFVEIRDALKNKQITRERKGDLDWFSLAK